MRNRQPRESSLTTRLTVVLLTVSNLAVAATVYAVPIYRLEFEGPSGDFITQGQHVVLTQQDVEVSTGVADLTGDGLVDGVQFNSLGVGQLNFLLFFDTDKIPAT
jgi:hypothetical protein